MPDNSDDTETPDEVLPHPPVAQDTKDVAPDELDSITPERKALLDSIEETESHFDPDAISTRTDPATGEKKPVAFGAMQMIPSTFAQYSKPGEQILGNEKDSRRVANRLVDHLSDKYNGDPSLIAAAYNGGEGHVDDAIKESGGKTFEEIAPYLKDRHGQPLTETLNYVPKVVGSLKKNSPAAFSQPESSEPADPVAGLLPSKDAIQGVQPTQAGFSSLMLPIVSSPEYLALPAQDKVAVMDKLFKSRAWAANVPALVKQTATDIWEGAPPEEKVNFTDLIGEPPLSDNGEPAKELASWQTAKTQDLIQNGINPAIFGTQLDDYFSSVKKDALEASVARDRSTAGFYASGAGNFIKDAFKGIGATVAKPIAYGARVAGYNQTADSIQNAPDAALDSVFGPDPRDFLYHTNPDGSIAKNADGTPMTRATANVAQGVGAIFSMIAAPEFAVAQGASKATVAVSALTAATGAIANDIHKDVFEKTGSSGRAFIASLGALPAGAVSTLGNWAIVARWAVPGIETLDTVSKARYLAGVAARTAPVEAAAQGSSEAISQLSQHLATGQPVDWNAVKQQAAIGAVVGSAISVFHQRGAVAPEKPAAAPTTAGQLQIDYTPLLGLPKPADTPGLPGPSPEQLRISGPTSVTEGAPAPIQVYPAASPEEQAAVVKKLVDLQKNPATVHQISLTEAKKIPPGVLEAMSLEPSVQGDQVLLTEKSNHIPVEPVDTVEGLNNQIAHVNREIAELPSPEDESKINMKALTTKRYELNKQLEAEVASVGRANEVALRERTTLQKTFDETKRLYENEQDYELRKIRRSDLDEARQAVETFDSQNQAVYDAHQKVGDTQTQLELLDKQIENGSGPVNPTNTLKAKQNNLAELVQRRQDLLVKEREKVNTPEAPLPVVKRGIEVEGTQIIPSGGRWYVVDGEDVIPHQYFNDAVETVKNLKTETPISEPQSFVVKNYEPDRTALSDAEKAKIEGDVAKEVEQKALTRKEAEKYRAKVYREETAKAIRKAKLEDAARKKLQTEGAPAEEPVSEVTALRGLKTGSTPESAAGASTEEPQVRAAGKSLGNEKERLAKSPQHKPLTSNYTKPTVFKRQSTKAVRGEDVIKAIQGLLDSMKSAVKIFQGGRTGARIRGLYDSNRAYIKLADFNDVQTGLHEVMHPIDDIIIGQWDPKGIGDYSNVPKGVVAAARDMAETFYYSKEDYNNRDPKLRPSVNDEIQEGLATFFQHYATGQPVRKELLDWYKNNFAKQNPEIFRGMENLKNMAHDYYNQDALTKGLAEKKTRSRAIVATISKAKKYLTTKRLQDEWVRDNQVLRDIDRAVGSPKDISQEGPNVLATADVNRGMARSLARTWVSEFIRDPYTNDRIGQSFEQAFAPAKGDFDVLDQYLLARNRAAEFKKGNNPGTNKEDVADVIKRVETEKVRPDSSELRYSNVLQASDNYYKALLNKDKVLSGISPAVKAMVDRRQAQNIEAGLPAHGFYVPTQRSEYSSFSSTKAKTGSTQDVVSPLSNIEQALYGELRKAFKYQTQEALVKASKVPVSLVGHYMREVTGMEKRGLEAAYDAKVKEVLGDNVDPIDRALFALTDPEVGTGPNGRQVKSLIDGKTVRFFEQDPRLAKLLAGEMPAVINTPFFKIVSFGNPFFREFATGARLAFQLVQAPRQAGGVFRTASSEAGGIISDVKAWPQDAYNLIRFYGNNLINEAMFAAGKGNPKSFAARVRAMGLSGVSDYGSADALRDVYSEKYGDRFIDLSNSTWSRIKDFIQVPNKALQNTAAELKFLSLGKTGPDGKVDLNATLTPLEGLEVSLAFKRGPTDYGVAGYSARPVSRVKPFFGAMIRHLSRIPEDFATNPSRMAATTLSVFAASVAHGILYKDDKDYQEIRPEEKQKHALFPISFNGLKKFMFVPLDTTLGLAWGAGQMVSEQINHQGSYTDLVDWAKGVFHDYSPADPYQAADFTGRIGREAIAQYANKDPFFDTPIVPDALKHAPAESQYNEYTTELAKRVAGAFDISPLRVQHAIDNFAPGIGDYLGRAEKFAGVRPAKDENAESFVFSAWLRPGGGTGISDKSSKEFYDGLEALNAHKIVETPEEGIVRKRVDKLHEDISDASVMIAGTADQSIRDELKIKRRDKFEQGIRIMNGSGEIPTTGELKAEADKQRKENTKQRSQRLIQGAAKSAEPASSEEE